MFAYLKPPPAILHAPFLFLLLLGSRYNDILHSRFRKFIRSTRVRQGKRFKIDVDSNNLHNAHLFFLSGSELVILHYAAPCIEEPHSGRTQHLHKGGGFIAPVFFRAPCEDYPPQERRARGRMQRICWLHVLDWLRSLQERLQCVQYRYCLDEP